MSNVLLVILGTVGQTAEPAADAAGGANGGIIGGGWVGNLILIGVLVVLGLVALTKTLRGTGFLAPLAAGATGWWTETTKRGVLFSAFGIIVLLALVIAVRWVLNPLLTTGLIAATILGVLEVTMGWRDPVNRSPWESLVRGFGFIAAVLLILAGAVWGLARPALGKTPAKAPQVPALVEDIIEWHRTAGDEIEKALGIKSEEETADEEEGG